MSKFVTHTACEDCGSSDALGLYDDGHTYCFSCGESKKGNGSKKLTKKSPTKAVPKGDYIRLKKRKLTKETCEKFGYHITDYDGQKAQVADYYNDSQELAAQKVRLKNKEFKFLKFIDKAPLFGQHLWKSGGKRIIVTEGEIDCMTVSQLQGHKWPVVSIPNGAQGAKRAFQENLEYLESFDAVIIMFDNDNPGKEAAAEAARVLSFGKAHIASLPLKDPNKMLQENRGNEVVTASWQAKEYRPSGIVTGMDTLEAVKAMQLVTSDLLPFDCLNQKTRGARRGEILTVCAGSGIGKSQVCREFGFHLSKTLPVGYIGLEESLGKGAQSFMSLQANKPLHLLAEPLLPKELEKLHEETFTQHKVSFYDHFGSLDSDDLISSIRYMHGSLGCQYIILDHISIVVSGISTGDERRIIDNIMTQLRSLVEEIGIGMILVTHLKRPDGKGHEEGGITSLSQLRGSAAIAQLSDIVIGGERNQQGKYPDLLTLRVLKNRFSGETGIAGHLRYIRETGRMIPVDPIELEFDDDAEENVDDIPF